MSFNHLLIFIFLCLYTQFILCSLIVCSFVCSFIHFFESVLIYLHTWTHKKSRQATVSKTYTPHQHNVQAYDRSYPLFLQPHESPLSCLHSVGCLHSSTQRCPAQLLLHLSDALLLLLASLAWLRSWRTVGGGWE